MKQNNIFNNKNGRDALARVREYKKTNIRYSYIEKFGIEKVEADLKDALGREDCSVKVCTETHQPMDLIKFYWYAGKTYKVHIPVMPTVIISIPERA